MFQGQIDSFFDCSEFDWMPAAAATQPSDYIHDMLGYLTTQFVSLTQASFIVPLSAIVLLFSTCTSLF